MFVLEPFLQLLFNLFFQLSIWYRKVGTSKGDCVIVPLLKDSSAGGGGGALESL